MDLALLSMGGTTLQVGTQIASIYAVSSALEAIKDFKPKDETHAKNKNGNVILWLNYEGYDVRGDEIAANSIFDVVEVTNAANSYNAISAYLKTNKVSLKNLVVWSHGNKDGIETASSEGWLAGDDTENYINKVPLREKACLAFIENMTALAKEMAPGGNFVFLACNAGSTGSITKDFATIFAKAGVSSLNIYMNKDESLYKEDLVTAKNSSVGVVTRWMLFDKPLNYTKNWWTSYKGRQQRTINGNRHYGDVIRKSLVISSTNAANPFSFRNF
ncbi:MAG: hypothetical protein JWP69_1713 [Flaviaesturariibacter sp.]|nr:hypothetical protein [Flaviaesturariibacter sp.]